MGPGIGALAPYAGFAESLRALADERGIPVTVVAAADDDAIDVVRRWEHESDVRVVLVREALAARLRAETSLFVVQLRYTAADFLAALAGVRAAPPPVGASGPVVIVQTAQRRHCDPVALGQALGLPIESLPVQGIGAVQLPPTEMGRLRSARAVVCDDPAVADWLRTNQIPAACVTYGPDTLQAALEQAADHLRVVRWERGRDHLGRILFELTGQGMVVANSKGVITAVRGRAEKLLGIDPRAAVGLTLAAAAHRYPRFASVLQDGSEVSGDILKAGDTTLVVDRRLLEVDGVLRGLVVSFQPASRIELLEGKIRKQLYTQGLVARYSFDDLVGHSQALSQAVARARQFARSDFSVLITGESGTGKELFAQSIHQASPRHDGPFVALNCAALPENLLESELFGYEEGAFTGARKGGKPGLFELAHNGTIFLDEIGELPLHLQARLLRVVEEREVRRLGGDRIVPVDVRIVAATNRNLGQAVADGHFRPDLYHRLSVLTLRLPPLRERPDDIALLSGHFLRIEAERQGFEQPRLPDNMVARLQAYDWPGNVRELANVIRRFLLLSAGAANPAQVLRELLAELPAQRTATETTAPAGGDFVQVRIGSLHEMTGEIITQLRRTRSWEIQELAQTLGISRTTVWKRLKQRRDSP